MDAWRSAPFGSLGNCKAIPTGRAWTRVFQIRRRWQAKGEWHEEVRYGVSSLPATIGIPQRLLKLKRGHWTIENGLHYVKDVTDGEKIAAPFMPTMDPKSWRLCAIRR